MADPLGLQTVLYPNLSGAFPVSFAETPTGTLLIANGIDPVVKWDPLAVAAVAAGVPAPASAPTLGTLGTGTIAGQYVAFVRYVDSDGNPSNLSPVADAIDTGRDGYVEDLQALADRVVVRSEAHGLVAVTVDGETVKPLVVIDGVEGPGFATVNGTWTATPVDDDTFTVPVVVTSGTYWQGGIWSNGAASITYTDVPVPSDARVARKQILRNLGGDADVLYVDLDLSTDEEMAGTAYLSSRSDEELATREAVPLNYGDDDLPWANRYGVPPSHKAFVAVHQGRGFLTGDVTYSDGHCEPAFNGTLVKGVGTAWKENWSGRLIYIEGAPAAYEIASVDEAAQTITLTAPYFTAPQRFATYAIRPAPGERRLLYFSEPGTADAWPAYNAVALPEDSDDITGVLVKNQFLYVLERRHVYRLTFQEDPLGDGFVFLVAHRGCVNNRCHVTVEGVTYMLDEAGVHGFDGQDTGSVSDSIQNIFQQDGTTDFQVDWGGDQRLWHAAHDPVRNTIRWFVSMVGQADMVNCLAYNYRQKRWWVEQYPTPMTASTVATLEYRRSLAGTEGRRVVCLAEGAYDGVDGTGTLRGTATAADAVSITDSGASFAALEGATVAIVEGTGRGQTNVVANNTATGLVFLAPWGVTPDMTSAYQVGGIPWVWRSGWFRTPSDEAESPRDVELVYQPLTVPSRVDLRLYFDHEAQPRVWAYSSDDDGKRVVDGSPYISFALDTQKGYVIQRLSGHADQYALGDYFVSLELSGVQAGEPVRIHEIILSGAGKE